ncbi:unnamed protein product, partial [Staurois parvus]
MALDRKGLTSGAIKGLTVCCFSVCAQAALYCSAVQTNTKQPVHARGEICVVYTQTSPLSLFLGNHRWDPVINSCSRQWRHALYPEIQT